MKQVKHQLIVEVYRADNQLVIFLNSREVYNRKTEGDPHLHDRIDLTSQLRRGYNSLVLIGIDWGVRRNFQGRVQIDHEQIPFHHQQDGSPANSGKVWDMGLELRYGN